MVNDLQHTILALTWSDEQSDKPDPINRPVMSLIEFFYVFQDGISTECLLEHNSTFRLTCIDVFVNVPTLPSVITNNEEGQSEEEEILSLPVKSVKHSLKHAKEEGKRAKLF